MAATAAFAAQLSPGLAAAHPPHEPGPAGHCPQDQPSLAKTVGKLAPWLLASPEVARSSQLVLHPTRCPCPCMAGEPMERAEALLGTRPACWGAGAQPLGCGVIPGYTGFIPRAQNLFAKTYTEICKEARSNLAMQQLRAMRKEQELQNAGRLPQGTQQQGKFLTATYRTPLPPVAAAAAPYVSPYAFQLLGSPYSMEENNPHKCFISGFTGFVPRARFLIGAGYPLTTHRALVEFSHMAHDRGGKPEAGKGSPVLPSLLKAYPTDMGLLPHYAGYVPGYKFQFGHTYGHLTHNALGLSTLEKQLAD
ncbi:ciliary microtubule inner protein 2B [Emydura macquarii macquarii]|uniref:ciliary microtubule inner protein 2B n=1 Tax=Emydura macquarii macquarii TaxID=1129001 RepID=UPI00352A8190